MNRTIVDIHILQTVPPSNLNRDDTGSPKTATYGGVRRARVSSQAWKKATRDAFDAYLDESELGTRTKRVVETLAERIEALEPDITAEDARKAAEAVFTAAKIKLTAPPAKKGAQTDVKVAKESDYLLFLSAQQLDAAARLAIESHHD
ncbi:MAG: type I-E CRISPR-associated protein Cas7/Cse4/CasC, partial [Promicromonosporaceae bacterium]|nr:type I-E CRISPR-associated protein Cas7/Cse4/CasC [Promicromonosporaceae bacterium]